MERQSYTLESLAVELRERGMTSARVDHTGGGVFVLYVTLDATGRDQNREIGVTCDGMTDADWLVCLYDHTADDHRYDGIGMDVLLAPGQDIADWIVGFARVTGTILP